MNIIRPAMMGSVLAEVRRHLYKNPNVHFVSEGVTHQDETTLSAALWVHASGSIPELDSVSRAAGVPIELFDCKHKEEQSNPLSNRGNPPVGGYKVGTNILAAGSFGLLGYTMADELVMITAAHTFAHQGSFNCLCRQPPTLKSSDLISTSCLTNRSTGAAVGREL